MVRSLTTIDVTNMSEFTKLSIIFPKHEIHMAFVVNLMQLFIKWSVFILKKVQKGNWTFLYLFEYRGHS